VDGASCILLPDQDIARLGLTIGSTINETDLASLQSTAELAEAMRVGLRYLSVRPRSCREIELRLLREKLEQETIEQTIDRLTTLGYLDDRNFAAAFARDRIRLRPCGVRRMKADLLSRGVSSCDADDGIESAMVEQDVNEHELLQQVASARASKLDDLDKGVARRRLFGYLSRRGFSSENVRKWIDTRWSEELH
tara:strand:+ start:1259 stop:1843 length:585 start_codon:yes stop_codon:yes gene_type:complete